jgi:NADH-quinone oxidoreductase subunit K
MIPVIWYVTLAAALFSIGVFGLLTQKSALRILIGIELVLNSANINFVAFANHYGDTNGLVYALFVIALAAAEAAVGLAIFIHVFRTIGTIDVSRPREMRW